MQAKRLASLEAKIQTEQESGKLGALREASKPVSVAMGSSLVNPLTGKPWHRADHTQTNKRMTHSST